MRFYHCSQNSYSISSITLRQLFLHNSTKTIIICHSKQIKTLCNQWFGALLCTSLSENFLNIHRKMAALESRLNKIMGLRVESFWHFQISNSVEHIRLPKVVAFKVARGLLRALPNIYIEAKYKLIQKYHEGRLTRSRFFFPCR